jgi:hypothetical protein
MVNLYSEIKNYVVRVKTLLSKALEGQAQLEECDDQETRLIIQYLLTLGEDKEHLKSIYTKIKAAKGKKLQASIMS